MNEHARMLDLRFGSVQAVCVVIWNGDFPLLKPWLFVRRSHLAPAPTSVRSVPSCCSPPARMPLPCYRLVHFSTTKKAYPWCDKTFTHKGKDVLDYAN